MNVTDRRQTDDRQTTDGRTTTYSECERALIKTRSVDRVKSLRVPKLDMLGHKGLTVIKSGGSKTCPKL